MSDELKDGASLDITAERLTNMMHEGRRTMPLEKPLLVCKPKKIESWRVFQIMSEFVEGFDIIRRYGLAVTFFGSSRATPDQPSYQMAIDLAGRLSKKGFAVVTGGSSGIMQAANKAAFEAGGASVGLNINLPTAQAYNPYLTEKYGFDHFFVRKVMLTYASEVYVYFPGGFGPLDEFFEIITLIQTKKIRQVPLILVGKEFWGPLLELFQNTLLEKYKAIDEQDLTLYVLVDTVDDAYDYIISHVTC